MERGISPTHQGLFEAQARGHLRIALSTITLAEVLVGPLRHGQDTLARRYERALSLLGIDPRMLSQEAGHA